MPLFLVGGATALKFFVVCLVHFIVFSFDFIRSGGRRRREEGKGKGIRQNKMAKMNKNIYE